MKVQCGDLQTQVIELCRQLEECRLQMEVLHGEITEKQNELDRAELARSEALRKMEALEVVIRTLRYERKNDLETARLKEQRLDERIRELEKENCDLYDRVTAIEVEKAQLLARSSFSHTSDSPNVPRELYEEWIHAKAQIDVFRDLHVARSVSGAALEGAYVKAREARVACGYDSATPEAGEDEGDEDVDRLEENAWYDAPYPEGEGGDGEGVEGQEGDLVEGQVGEDPTGDKGGGQ
nr:uncharacterized protein LOC117276658 [Nicotiana tomentosiformis]XP_033511876.1 uncharacterized protein LOC117276658 [Nicotiana tomentosiformis]